MNRIIKMMLWFCLVLLLLLNACAGKTTNVSKYALMVVAGRGKLFFGHRVVYAVDEYGAVLNLDLPKQEDLGNTPEWSPDGYWIAHSNINPNAKSASDYDIYIMAASDHSKTIRVTHNLTFPLAPAWSPDSTQLAIVAYTPDVVSHYGIYLLNVACLLRGENCAPKPAFLIPGGSPAWSPDGKKIVYKDTSSEIQVVDVHNPGKTVKVGEGLSSCDSPQWSHDGKRIAFTCNGTIYSADSDGGNRVSLVTGASSYLRWTPDGKRIAFIGTKILDPSLGQILEPDGQTSSTAVFMIDADGNNITRITKSNEESIGSFTWIPTNRIK